MDRGLDLRVSTFSDNVVITQKPGATTPQLLMQLAIWQLGAAANGFLLRGGVTVGDVLHEEEGVFGPAMNRAYYLESRCAVFPRIMLDPLAIDEMGEFGALCSTEDSVTFLDPFRLAFCEHLRSGESATAETLKKAGLPVPQGVYAQLTNEEVLAAVADSLRAQMQKPTAWKDFRLVDERAGIHHTGLRVNPLVLSVGPEEAHHQNFRPILHGRSLPLILRDRP